MQPGNEEIIQAMVKSIVEKFNPEKVILFGSHARGNASPKSDIDLLIIMPIEGSRRKKMVEIYGALGPVGIPKDILVFTPDDIEKYGQLLGTILKPALEEGKVLYERNP